MKPSLISTSLRVTAALCFLSTTSPVDANLMPFMNPYEEVVPVSRRSLSHNVEKQEGSIKNLINQLRLEATLREIQMKRRLGVGHATIDPPTQTNDNKKAETTHRCISTKKSGLSSRGGGLSSIRKVSKKSSKTSKCSEMTANPPTEVISRAPSTMQAQAPSRSEDQSNVSGDNAAMSEDQGPISGDSPAVSGDQGPISGDSPAVSEDQGTISGDSPAVSEDGDSEQREDNPDIDKTVPIDGSDGGVLTDSDQDTANDEDNEEPRNDEDEGSIINDVDVNDGDEAVEEEVEILTDLWEFAMVRTAAGTPDSEEDFNLTSVIAMAGVLYDFDADGTINTDETVGEFSATCVVVSEDHSVLCTYQLRFLTPNGTSGLGELTARGHVVNHQNENSALITGTAFDWAQYRKGGNLVMQPDPEDSLTLLCSLTLRYAEDAAIN